MKTKILFLYLCCVGLVLANTSKVLESIALLGQTKSEAYATAQKNILPGARVEDGVKTKHFTFEHDSKPVYFSLAEDTVGKIMSASWQFNGAKWQPKELLKMHQELYHELVKRGWKIVGTAALVDNLQLFGSFSFVGVPRGANTTNIGVTLRRESPLAEITLVLGLPIDGVADDFVPALVVELENSPLKNVVSSEP